MNRWNPGRVVSAAAFVAGGWLAATIAHGQVRPLEPSKEAVDLEARVKALEAWRAQAGTFTTDASGNWVFAPQRGDVNIRSTQGVNIRADQTFQVRAATSMSLEAGMNANIVGGAQTSVKGPVLLLNAAQGSGKPAATVGSMVSGSPGGAPGQVLTGSNSVLVGL
jgi:VCBS repeat-containing protein